MPRRKHKAQDDAQRTLQMCAALDAALSEDVLTITYRPSWVTATGSITAAILLQQVYYRSRHSQHEDGRFYKFKEACSHKLYRPGDSWTEELGFTRTEFDSALKRIARRIKPDSQAQHTAPAEYWTTAKRVTWYRINWQAFWPFLADVYKLYQESSFSPSRYIRNPALATTTNVVVNTDTKNREPRLPSRLVKLSRRFHKAQQRNWPRYIKSVTSDQVNRGAVQLDRLIRLDDHSYKEVKAALLWLVKHTDQFWCKNLRSLSSVRKMCRDDRSKFSHVLEAYDEAHKEQQDSSGELTTVERKVFDALSDAVTMQDQQRVLCDVATALVSYYSALPTVVKDRYKYSSGAVKLARDFQVYVTDAHLRNVGAKALHQDGKLWQSFIRSKEQALGVSFRTGNPI